MKTVKEQQEQHTLIAKIAVIFGLIAIMAGIFGCTSISGHKLEEREQARLDSIAKHQQWYYIIDLGNRNLIKAIDYEKITGRIVGDSVCVNMNIDEFNPQFSVVTSGHWIDTDGIQPIYDEARDSIVDWMHYDIGVIVAFAPQSINDAWPK